MENKTRDARCRALDAPPKISVVVLAYNVEQYIRACLESLLLQTFENFEIIVVDDGSQDDTPAQIDAAMQADVRIICVRHKTNLGTFRARLTGAEVARGDYFCMVDGDDTVDADYLFALHQLIEQEDCDVSECAMMAATRNGKVGLVPRSELSPRRVTGVKILHMALMESIWHTASNKLFSRKLYLNAKTLYDAIEDHITVADDKLFVLPMLCFARKFARTERILYWYRDRAGSSTRARGEASNLRHIQSTGCADNHLLRIFQSLRLDKRTYELLEANRRQEVKRFLRIIGKQPYTSTSRNLLVSSLVKYYDIESISLELEICKGFFRGFLRFFVRYSLGSWYRLILRTIRHTAWGAFPSNRRRVINMMKSQT